MRPFFWTNVTLAAALVMGSRVPAVAQGDAPGGPAASGQGRGQGGGRGGFGGQAVQGTVTAASAEGDDPTEAGETYTVTVSDTTRVMKDRQPIKIGDVKVGDGAMAMGAVDATAKTVQAMMLMDVDAATLKKAREDMGKTYIAGRITAIDADSLKLTVMRTDEVSQVIQVDEGTSFQRGARGIQVPSAFGMGGGMGGGRGMGAGGGAGAGNGAAPAVESITLADVKVGDAVVATGAMKSGVFVPVKMGVTEPGAGRRRGPAAGDGAPAVPGTPPPPGQ